MLWTCLIGLNAGPPAGGPPQPVSKATGDKKVLVVRVAFPSQDKDVGVDWFPDRTALDWIGGKKDASTQISAYVQKASFARLGFKVTVVPGLVRLQYEFTDFRGLEAVYRSVRKTMADMALADASYSSMLPPNFDLVLIFWQFPQGPEDWRGQCQKFTATDPMVIFFNGGYGNFGKLCPSCLFPDFIRELSCCLGYKVSAGSWLPASSAPQSLVEALPCNYGITNFCIMERGDPFDPLGTGPAGSQTQASIKWALSFIKPNEVYWADTTGWGRRVRLYAHDVGPSVLGSVGDGHDAFLALAARSAIHGDRNFGDAWLWVEYKAAATAIWDASNGVHNFGQSCEDACQRLSGPCDFCGSGYCCRYGRTSSTCDGKMGIRGRGHVCVANPKARQKTSVARGAILHLASGPRTDWQHDIMVSPLLIDASPPQGDIRYNSSYGAEVDAPLQVGRSLTLWNHQIVVTTLAAGCKDNIPWIEVMVRRIPKAACPASQIHRNDRAGTPGTLVRLTTYTGTTDVEKDASCAYQCETQPECQYWLRDWLSSSAPSTTLNPCWLYKGEPDWVYDLDMRGGIKGDCEMKVCPWSTHVNVSAGVSYAGNVSNVSYAGNVSTIFMSPDAAKRACVALGSTCKAITCRPGGICTMRGSPLLTNSTSGETTYVRGSPCSLKAPYERIASTQICDPQVWLNIDGDLRNPSSCIAEISRRPECSQKYFNHEVTQYGGGRCGCITDLDIECDLNSNRQSASLVHTYRIQASYTQVAVGRKCVLQEWLMIYDTNPASCLAEISKRPECSQTYFNHATGKDGNCGCVKDVNTNCEDSSNQVDSPVVYIYAIKDRAPTIHSILHSPDRVCIGQPVKFTCDATDAGTHVSLLAYEWDFKGRLGHTSREGEWTFEKKGNAHVRCRVSDGTGHSTTKAMKIFVGGPDRHEREVVAADGANQCDGKMCAYIKSDTYFYSDIYLNGPRSSQAGFFVGMSWFTGFEAAVFAFGGVAVPRSTNVEAAYLTLVSRSTSSNVGTVSIRVELSATADALTAGLQDDWRNCKKCLTSGRTWSSQSVAWRIPDLTAGARFETPNIAPLIKELVANISWSGAGRIVVAITPLDGTGVAAVAKDNSTLILRWQTPDTTHGCPRINLLNSVTATTTMCGSIDASSTPESTAATATSQGSQVSTSEEPVVVIATANASSDLGNGPPILAMLTLLFCMFRLGTDLGM